MQLNPSDREEQMFESGIPASDEENLLGLGSDDDDEDDDIFGDESSSDAGEEKANLVAAESLEPVNLDQLKTVDVFDKPILVADNSTSQDDLTNQDNLTNQDDSLTEDNSTIQGATDTSEIPRPSPRKSAFYTTKGDLTRNTNGEVINFVPSLTQLCLSRIRKLRCRIEGLALLPVEVVAAIVEGSTADELKQMEQVNKGVTSIPIWDSFWEAVGQKSMPPTQLARKPADESWRDYCLRNEQEKKTKLIEAGQRCRDRWNNLQISRDRTVALDDGNHLAGTDLLGTTGRRKVVSGLRGGGSSSSSVHRPSGGASAGAVKAIRKSLSAGFSPSRKLSSSAAWQNRVPPNTTKRHTTALAANSLSSSLLTAKARVPPQSLAWSPSQANSKLRPPTSHTSSSGSCGSSVVSLDAGKKKLPLRPTPVGRVVPASFGTPVAKAARLQATPLARQIASASKGRVGRYEPGPTAVKLAASNLGS